MKCYVLGPAGTNGHEVAKRIWPNLNLGKQELEFRKSNTQILESCHLLPETLGVVPVENSTAGLVSEVVNQILRGTTLRVFRSVIIPINHCLAVHHESNLDLTGHLAGDNRFTMVLSHPQALAQCSKILDRNGIMVRKPASSTADAAKEVANSKPEENIGAICSKFSAKEYGLKVLQENFQDSKHNATKFYLFGDTGVLPYSFTPYDDYPNPDKVVRVVHSLVLFRLNNQPSALADALWAFGGGRGINLSSIHSIPTGKMGEVAFWCEFAEHHLSKKGKLALNLLGKVAYDIQVLGSFYVDVLD